MATNDLAPLAASLAIGLLVGIERGWSQRQAAKGTRAAGVRTFGLLGLLGGLCGEYTSVLGPALPLVGLGVLGALLVVAYAASVRQGRGQGATTEVAALLTYLLGLGPPLGYGMATAAAAVMVTVLLSWKARIHRAVAAIERLELQAALKLLALAFVLLPVLPDVSMGPWQAINPRSILWMVLLLGGFSFLGYITLKTVRARLGLPIAALLGSLVSSTAVTLDFSRRARAHPPLVPLLAAGVLAAGGTMFARILVLVTVLNPALLSYALAPLLASAVACFAGAALMWWRTGPVDAPRAVQVENPLALGLAVQLALLLAGITLAAAALRAWVGDAALYPLAAVAGIADVDAITLSLARQAQGDLPPEVVVLPPHVAVYGIAIACAVNTLVKVVLARFVGGRGLGGRVALGLAVALLAGTVGLLLPLL